MLHIVGMRYMRSQLLNMSGIRKPSCHIERKQLRKRKKKKIFHLKLEEFIHFLEFPFLKKFSYPETSIEESVIC